MEQIARPNTLHIYNSLRSYNPQFQYIAPWLVTPTLLLAQKPELFDNTPPESLGIAYGGWSIASFDAPNLQLISSIAFFACLYAAVAKYQNRNLSLWKNFTFEQLPITTCTYLPALAVKQVFFIATGRSSVDHSKRKERIASIVMTVAVSTFAMPHVFARLKGDITPISHRGLTKYFGIQSIWHLTINELLATTAEAMRRDIQTKTQTWFDAVLNPEYNLTDPGYGLAKALVEALNPDNLPDEATPEVAKYYLSAKHLFDELIKEQDDSGQAKKTLEALEGKIREKYSYLLLTNDAVKEYTPPQFLIINEKEVPLYQHFLLKHSESLPKDSIRRLLMALPFSWSLLPLRAKYHE